MQMFVVDKKTNIIKGIEETLGIKSFDKETQMLKPITCEVYAIIGEDGFITKVVKYQEATGEDTSKMVEGNYRTGVFNKPKYKDNRWTEGQTEEEFKNEIGRRII